MSDPEPGTGAGAGTLFRLWLKPKVSVPCGSSSGSAALRRDKKCIKNSMYSFFMNVLYSISRSSSTRLYVWTLHGGFPSLLARGPVLVQKHNFFQAFSLLSSHTPIPVLKYRTPSTPFLPLLPLLPSHACFTILKELSHEIETGC
jgi:hypothetical protein